MSSEVEYANDGVRVYDSAGILLGHLGSFETLADQIAAFARASVAYKQDGTQVVSDAPRYEYARQPAPVWQDMFDTDQLAAQYTSGGDSPATWAVSGGVLTGTGGAQAILIKNNLIVQDCEIEVNSDQAGNSGVVARYQNNNNYYVLCLSDDSGDNPSLSLRLNKRVGGVYTQFATADITWPRGTSKRIKWRLCGSLQEVYVNETKYISATDTALTGGGVGLRNNSATAAGRFLDFEVYSASQGIMAEEGTTNLLTANQSHPISGTTGFQPVGGATISQVASPSWAGGGALHVLCPNTSDWYGAGISLLSLTGGIPYTFSVYVRGSGSVGFGLSQGSFHVWLAAIGPITLTDTWQRITFTYTPTSAASDYYLSIQQWDSPVVSSFYIDGLQMEQKAYATSWQIGGTARAAETLAIPTAGVLTKGNWAVELVYNPKTAPALVSCWGMQIDANNWYRILIYSNGAFQCSVTSGGTEQACTGTLGIPFSAGTPYAICFCGNGSTLSLFVNNTQFDAISYAETIGALPASMYIGSDGAGNQQCDGPIHDLRISNRARTLVEHQAYYNSGKPQESDGDTALLMRMGYNLNQTTRKFGLWLVSGEIGAGTAIAGNPAGNLETKNGAQSKANAAQDTAINTAAANANIQISNHNALQSPHNLPSYCKMQNDGFKIFDAADLLRAHWGQVEPGVYGGKVFHSDGSYTRMDADGFKRYIAGAGKRYHYLINVGEDTTRQTMYYLAYFAFPTCPIPINFPGGSTWYSGSVCSWTSFNYTPGGDPPSASGPYGFIYDIPVNLVANKTVTLPSEYRGKDFQVFLYPKRIYTESYIIVYQGLSCKCGEPQVYLNVVSKDIPNGTFTVQAYTYQTFDRQRQWFGDAVSGDVFKVNMGGYITTNYTEYEISRLLQGLDFGYIVIF